MLKLGVGIFATVLVASGLAGCSLLGGESQPTTYSVAGDSISAATKNAGGPGGYDYSWTTYASSPDVVLTPDGYARGGAMLEQIADHQGKVSSKVFVVMAGTNDEGDRWGTPMAVREQALHRIVSNSGATRVLIAAVPPRDGAPQWATEWNVRLEQLAIINGWSFVDPWVEVRGADAQYLPGATTDGVHPTIASAQAAGRAMRPAIIEAGKQADKP